MTPVFRADRLKAYMAMWGMTVPKLAEAIGVSHTTAYSLLSGCGVPQMRTMYMLHDVTGLPYDYLVSDLDEAEAPEDLKRHIADIGFPRKRRNRK